MLRRILKRKKSFLRKHMEVRANKTMRVSGEGFEVIINLSVLFAGEVIIEKTIIV